MRTASQLTVQELNVHFEQLKEQLKEQREQKARANEQEHATAEAILRVVAKRNSEALSSMGLDLAALKNQSQGVKSQIQEIIDKFNKAQRDRGGPQERSLRSALRMHAKKRHAPPPPPAPSANDWLQPFLEWLAEHSQLHGQLNSPAYGCEYEQGCAPESGTICMQLHSSGVGGIWGWEATVNPAPDLNEIIYVYIPQIPGLLTATAHVDMRGTASIYTDNPGFWVRADSYLTMRMHCGIHQDSLHYRGDSWIVIDEHRGNSHQTRNFAHERYDPSSTGYVNANTPVFISVAYDLTGTGRSDYGHVDLDACMSVVSIDVSLETAPGPNY